MVLLFDCFLKRSTCRLSPCLCMFLFTCMILQFAFLFIHPLCNLHLKKKIPFFCRSWHRCGGVLYYEGSVTFTKSAMNYLSIIVIMFQSIRCMN